MRERSEGGEAQWRSPIPFMLIRTSDPESFRTMPRGATGLPVGDHPGAFGAQRRYHTHEGVDLYCPTATPVMAVEAGEVVAIKPFTGAAVGSPWWRNTHAVFVEGASGLVVYGEIAAHIRVGAKVVAGELLGVVLPVLQKDKGRPLSMLHLELRPSGAVQNVEWLIRAVQPKELRDPTPYLLPCCVEFDLD